MAQKKNRKIKIILAKETLELHVFVIPKNRLSTLHCA